MYHGYCHSIYSLFPTFQLYLLLNLSYLNFWFNSLLVYLAWLFMWCQVLSSIGRKVWICAKLRFCLTYSRWVLFASTLGTILLNFLISEQERYVTSELHVWPIAKIPENLPTDFLLSNSLVPYAWNVICFYIGCNIRVIHYVSSTLFHMFVLWCLHLVDRGPCCFPFYNLLILIAHRREMQTLPELVHYCPSNYRLILLCSPAFFHQIFLLAFILDTLHAGELSICF